MTNFTRRGILGVLLASTVMTVGFTHASLADDVTKVVFLVNGNLGDKSFFDLGALGMTRLKEKYGDRIETRTIEMGVDQTKWLPTFQDVSEQDWDLIVATTFEIADIVAEVAAEYPDKQYALIDSQVDYSGGEFGNVYSVVYKQNEGSYLAGILAAGLVADGSIPADAGENIGFLGAMDVPVINDFLMGYIEGAQSVTPDVKIAVSYIGSFNDAAKGKELALAQFRSGTAIGFNVAGMGQLAAGKELGRYSIGVNSDQEALFRETDPELADLVASSMLKKVDNTMVRAVDLFIEGTLPFGTVEEVGLKEDAVGLAETGVLASLASAELLATIEAAKASIIGGEVVVTSAFAMDQASIEAKRTEVRP